MYCPKCATQNADDARFCRVCGTALEVVALALGKLVPKKKSSKTKALKPAETLELKRAKGMRDVVTGSIMMAVSLLILLGPMPFIRQAFPWLVIWSTMFGWLAVWGTISLSQGLGQVLSSNSATQPEPQRIGIEPALTTSELLGASEERNALEDRSKSCDVAAPPSVTETTTRNLNARSE